MMPALMILAGWTVMCRCGAKYEVRRDRALLVQRAPKTCVECHTGVTPTPFYEETTR